MFFEPKVVFEHSSARAAIVMTIFEVFFEVLRVRKMIIAVLAIRVAGTLDPMILQTRPRWKVFVAVVADVMIGGICFMLPKSTHATEGAVAASAIRHVRCNAVTLSNEGSRRGQHGLLAYKEQKDLQKLGKGV